MRKDLKYAWIASWFALVGQLVFFIGVSIFTGNWRFVVWSLVVSVVAGVPSMMKTRKAQNEADAIDSMEQINNNA